MLDSQIKWKSVWDRAMVKHAGRGLGKDND